MKFPSKALAKASVATIAAGAIALTSASPAMARDRDRDGIDTGDILTGALIIGGIAAVAAIASDDDDRRDRRYRDRYDRGARYDRRDQRRAYRGNYQQDAVNMCVHAAQRNAARYAYGGRAQVTDIRDVDRERRGYEVKGRIAVQNRDRGWRRSASWDEGRFECRVRNGRVVDLDYSGVRGF